MKNLILRDELKFSGMLSIVLDGISRQPSLTTAAAVAPGWVWLTSLLQGGGGQLVADCVKLLEIEPKTKKT